MFLLVHSPLTGPFVWHLVAEELRRRGHTVRVPSLATQQAGERPYWRQHVGAAVRSLGRTPPEEPLIVAAHSGAGALLPAVRRGLGGQVAAYLFVDAMIPHDQNSRLDLLREAEGAEAAEGFRRSAAGGYLPVWTDGDLRQAIPDPDRRRRFLEELRPLPLAVYQEPLPVFAGWPDAPCGYLRFGTNPAYDAAARKARRQGWAYAELAGSHFHMLVDPAAVAETLLRVSDEIGVLRSGR
jgi:hypothetical protein